MIEIINSTKNWTMRCIDNASRNENIYTNGKIYKVRDLCFMLDNRNIFNLRSKCVDSFKDFQDYSSSIWELVDDKYAEIEKYLYK